MLNENRIKLMTKAAAFEQHEKNNALVINRYKKGDYISLQMIKTGIYVTICYLALWGLWAFYKSEHLMKNLNMDELTRLGTFIAIGYIVLLIVYLVISFFVFSRRYQEGMKRIKKYNEGLKQISRLYQEEAEKSQSSLGGDLHDNEYTGA